MPRKGYKSKAHEQYDKIISIMEASIDKHRVSAESYEDKARELRAIVISKEVELNKIKEICEKGDK